MSIIRFKKIHNFGSSDVPFWHCDFDRRIKAEETLFNIHRFRECCLVQAHRFEYRECAAEIFQVISDQTLLEWPLFRTCREKITPEKNQIMPYVIAEPCQKNSNCVDVCPVDCIHPRRDETQFTSTEQAYIDPAACINCGLCVPVCPVSAIFVVSDLPDAWKKYVDINAHHYEVSGKAYALTAKRHAH